VEYRCATIRSYVQETKVQRASASSTDNGCSAQLLTQKRHLLFECGLSHAGLFD